MALATQAIADLDIVRHMAASRADKAVRKVGEVWVSDQINMLGLNFIYILTLYILYNLFFFPNSTDF